MDEIVTDNIVIGEIVRVFYGYRNFEDADMYLELEIKMLDGWNCLMRFNQHLIKPILDAFFPNKNYRSITYLVGEKVYLMEKDPGYAPIAITPYSYYPKYSNKDPEWFYRRDFATEKKPTCSDTNSMMNAISGLKIHENKELSPKTHKVCYNEYNVPLEIECSSVIYQQLLQSFGIPTSCDLIFEPK